MKHSHEHKRINDIWLANIEKPAIHFLSRKMPRWVTPDMLTLIGFLAAFLIAASYWLSNFDPAFLWLASFGFMLNWFGDSLDGSLARFRKIERPRFGYFIDHTVDAITQVIIGLGIGLSPYVDLKYALFLLTGYLLVSIHTYITIYIKGVFKISYGRCGPTEIRVLAITVNTLLYWCGIPEFRIPILELTLYNLFALLTGSALILTYIVSAARQAVELAALEQAIGKSQ